MLISLIAAMTANRVIGFAGDIPWKIPGEQKMFKTITFGHTVIMGRKTFESLGRPLPGRTNIVVTRQGDYRAPGCFIAHDLDSALKSCRPGESEAFICGGGQLYHQALPMADKIYLTVLPREIPGDTFFPAISELDFGIKSSEVVNGDEPYNFIIYERTKRIESIEENKMTHNAEEDYGWNQDMTMSLLGKIRSDLKKSTLNRDAEVKNTLRLIMAEFPKLTVPITLESGKKSTRLKKPEEITNADIIGVIQGLIKSERILLEAMKAESSEYLRILESYLPQMASREQVVAWIKENIDFPQYKNKMQAMGTIMKHFGKTADGKMVNAILRGWS